MNEERRHTPKRRITDSLMVDANQMSHIDVSRKAYLYANGFEALIAFSAILSGIRFFVDPSALADTVIGQALRPLDQIWNAMYCIGGLLVCIGLPLNRNYFRVGRLRVSGYRLELGGLIFLSTGVLVAGVAAVWVNGFSTGVSIYGAVVLASIGRIISIVSTRKATVPVEVPVGGGGIQ
jgi:hypothetical protein